MSEAIPVTLPDELIAGVNAISAADGVSRGELIRNAVEEYLADRKFHDLRARLVPKAQQAGFFTDEDVFREVS